MCIEALFKIALRADDELYLSIYEFLLATGNDPSCGQHVGRCLAAHWPWP